MKLRPQLLILILISVGFFCLAASPAQGPAAFPPKSPVPSASSTSTPSTLTITHFNVGTGDATLVLFNFYPKDNPNKTTQSVLIDGGDVQAAQKVVIPGLRKAHVTELKFAIATHYDPEHRDGLQTVITEIPMSMQGVVYDRDRGWPSINDVSSPVKTVENQPLLAGSEIILGGEGDNRVVIKCVAANGATATWRYPRKGKDIDENAQSLAFLITFKKFSYFIGGDLTGGGKSGFRSTPDIESAVAKEVGEVTVLRVNHHGSDTSSNQGFLAALNPSVAVISSGKTPLNDRLFQWPSRKVLDRLTKLPRLTAIYITGQVATLDGLTEEDKKKVKDVQGDITISTTGDGTFQVNSTSFPPK